MLNEENVLANIQLIDDYLNQDNLFGEKEILIIQKATDKLLNYVDIEHIEKKIILIEELYIIQFFQVLYFFAVTSLSLFG